MASSTKFDNLAQTLVSVFTFRPKNKNKTYVQCIPKQNNLKSMSSKGNNEYTYENSHSIWCVKSRENNINLLYNDVIIPFNEVLHVKDTEFQFARKVYRSLV